jgi:hypothetical protein
MKYRLKSSLRTIQANLDNQNLILEFVQSFVTVFSKSTNGLVDLGFEITQKDQKELSFFYFTDDDITEEVFKQQIERVSQNFWSVIFIRKSPDENLPISFDNTSELFNFMEHLVTLETCFKKIGIRVAQNKWSISTTNNLLKALSFNDTNLEVPKQGADIITINNTSIPAYYLQSIVESKFTVQKIFNRQVESFTPILSIDYKTEKEKIIYKIEKSNLKDALDDLGKLVIDSQKLKKVSLFKGHLSQSKNSFQLMLISHADYSVELARLRHAILNFLDEIN